MPNIQPNNGKFKLDNVLFQNAKFLLNNNQFLIGCVLTYKDTTIQNGSTYQKSYNILVNAFTLDGIDIFDKIGGIDFRLSNTNQYIAFHTVDMYNGLEVYDFNTKQLLWKIPVNGPSLTGLEFSPDDKYLVTASSNNSFGMTIWDMTTGKEHFHYISGATYSNIDVSNDGKYITYSIGDGLRLIRTHFDGVSVNESDNTVLTLYPNPTNNSITLTFELKLPCQLNYSIFNEKGQLIKSLLDEFTNPGTISQSFDVTNLPTGTYFLKISGADFGLTFKVMIMR
jgi:DNA-binding beta-propeller fold protein YncE